jgi:hypothetical protein
MSFCPHYYHNLKSAFSRCAEAAHQGIEGVLVFEGREPGKTAGITICTHGDEPVGLSLLCEQNDWLKPDRGTVFVVLNNLAATTRFFEGDKSTRHLERNMNRLPEDLSSCSAIETIRAKQLAPIWQQFTAGALDIHSTSTDCPTLLIARENNLQQYSALYNHLPVEAFLSGLIDNFEGQPVIDFYPTDTPRAILECGQHHDKNGAAFLKNCIQQWLFNLGLKNTSPTLIQKQKPAHYHVFQAVRLPDNDESFSYLSPILPFQKIKKDEPVAKGNRGTIIVSPADGYAIMAPTADKPLSTKEEFFFLAERRDGGA